jgi:hypothetical protein
VKSTTFVVLNRVVVRAHHVAKLAVLFVLQCGQTPLMIAAEQGNVEIVKELIKNGANCNLEDLVCIK